MVLVGSGGVLYVSRVSVSSHGDQSQCSAVLLCGQLSQYFLRLD